MYVRIPEFGAASDRTFRNSCGTCQSNPIIVLHPALQLTMTFFGPLVRPVDKTMSISSLFSPWTPRTY